jgi:hypothetical protein
LPIKLDVDSVAIDDFENCDHESTSYAVT